MIKRGTRALTSGINNINFSPKSKRSQVTIFIIVAIVIVVSGILVYYFYPSIKSTFGLESKNPTAYLQECIEDDIKNALQLVSLQGGSREPEHFFLYNNSRVEYLCYTIEYYKTCIMQQPMLKLHIEKEVAEIVRDNAKSCFESLEENYRKKGYEVNSNTGEIKVELLPRKAVLTFNNSLTITKEETERYSGFNIFVDSKYYELISIANSILNWEANYGDAETTTYMNYYHDLKVEKKKQTDGTTIYILTNRNTGEVLQFASRSVAWPPGYGVESVI